MIEFASFGLPCGVLHDIVDQVEEDQLLFDPHLFDHLKNK